MARPPQSSIIRGALIAAAVALAVTLAACGGSATTAPSSAHLTPLARGKQLYKSDGCEDCHTLDGAKATGPTWKGLYGSRVSLTSGRTVTANVAYLTKHIVDPDAMTVRGFPGSVMAEAIQSDGLAHKPADVRALVALIKSLQ
jgi:hypothetical protein